MVLRPDELASQTQIEYAKKGAGLIKKGVGAAATALGGVGASRILPFLSEFVPSTLAVKGLKKVSPKIGEFIEKTMENGFNTNSVFDFLRNQFEEKPQNETAEQEPAKKGNPLQDFETNYPELAQGLMNTIQNGQSPEAAAGILKTSTALGKQVKKLEKEIGMNFVDYVLQLFGPQGGRMQQQQQPQQQQQMGGQQQQSGQTQGQGGEIDQQLMAALDKILKM